MPTPQQIRDELVNNPIGLPYKNADGTWKNAVSISQIGLGPRTKPNPVAQPQVPKSAQQRAATLRRMLSPAILATFSDEALTQLTEALRRREPDDFETIRLWAHVAKERGKIPAGQLTAAERAIDATEPDPAWTPTVADQPRFTELWGIGFIHAAQVQEALDLIGP